MVVLIIFPVILQTDINVIMLSIVPAATVTVSQTSSRMTGHAQVVRHHATPLNDRST